MPIEFISDRPANQAGIHAPVNCKIELSIGNEAVKDVSFEARSPPLRKKHLPPTFPSIIDALTKQQGKKECHGRQARKE
jgi:hypothetical protein